MTSWDRNGHTDTATNWKDPIYVLIGAGCLLLLAFEAIAIIFG